MTAELATTRPETALIRQWGEVLSLEVRAGDITETSGATYRRGLEKFMTWLSEKSYSLVTPEVIQTWKSEQLAQHKPSTVNTWYAGIKRFFGWAVGAGLLAVNPTSGVKNVKRKGTNKRHLRDALTDREVLRVLAQPDRSADQGKRDYAILALMAYCGLREVEIHRADLDDLATEGGMMVLRVQGKGSSEKDDTAVIFNPKAQDALYDWLAVRGKKPGPLFVSFSDRSKGERIGSRTIRGLVEYMRAAGIQNGRKTLHSLRHSAISKVAKKDILKARQVARHSSIDTTMIYVHEADRLDNPGEQFIDYGE